MRKASRVVGIMYEYELDVPVTVPDTMKKSNFNTYRYDRRIISHVTVLIIDMLARARRIHTPRLVNNKTVNVKKVVSFFNHD